MNTGDPKKDQRSKDKLAGVHPKLVHLITAFAKDSQQQFVVTEGLRTPERQKQLVQAGASKTLHSKHLTGRAVDLAVVVGGEIRWNTQPYKVLGAEIKAFALKERLTLIWGGDWKTFRDYCHFQLGDNE